jgi:Carboxypeptidase regulatory-like domain/TonB dependent receptor
MWRSNSVGTRVRLALFVLLLTPLVAMPAAAQTSMGGVNGLVVDAQGGVLPGATVTLTNDATGIQTVRQTNESGYFVFVNVRPGTYTLTVELQGLQTAKLSGFTVAVNETVSRNVTLQVGSLTEVVEVTGRSEILQTTSAALGQVVEEKVIKELPLQGRNFTSLMLLTPGVNPVSTAQGPQAETAVNSFEGNSGIPGGQVVNASIQGQQNRSKIYYVDGIVNTSVRSGTYVALPDIDSLQEFKVESHSDKAEFGGVTGGVINMISKSGSNRFTGAGFEFFRDARFAARNPFRDFNRDDHPPYRQNQYGGSLGGPIVQNRAFFFASYDGWQFRDQAQITHTVPAAGELDGDFSQTFHRRTIYNPYTTRVENGRTVRDPFPGNIIPKELISPTMQAFLKAYMVRPNQPGNVSNNFRAAREQENTSNSFQGRVDYHLSARDNMFFRWTERRNSAIIPRGDLGYIEPDSSNRNVGGGWFHSFSTNMIVEVRGGIATQPTEDAPMQHPLGFEPQRALNLPELDRFQGYIVNGLGAPWNLPTLGVQGPRPRGNPNWNVAADLTWLRGRHNLKFGFQRLQINRLQRNQFGELIFNTEPTRNPQATSNTGDAIASALLGFPGQIRAYVPDLGYIDFRTATTSGYFQDQWALRRNLTLNYGLRYDYVGPVIGNHMLQSGPDLGTGEWLLALESMPGPCTAGQPPPCLPSALEQIPFNQFIRVTGQLDSIIKPIKDNWGPRVGLAWEVNPNTIVRSGYGLVWDSMISRSQYGQHQFETWGWPQFSGIDTGSINREGGAITRVDDVDNLPFAAPRAAPWNSTGYFNDPDRKNAYSHQWNVQVQRQFTRSLMAAVGYVGSYNGRMEYAGRAQAPPVAAVDATGRRLTTAERNALRPWPHIDGTFTYSDSIGMSKYNALQAIVQQRFSDGLSSIFSYTWSRSIDTSSGWFNAEGGIGGGATVQNYHDIDGNRGVSSYDIPHIVTWATVWELPFGRGKRWLESGPASWVLGNWQVNWMLLARSGQPFTPTVGGDPANLGHTGYARPNIVGDPELSNPTVDRWFDAAAFAIPVNEFGNAGRNILRAPGYWTVDLGVMRNVRLGPDRVLQLRIESFNVFNHINLGNPAIAIDNPATVGTITSMSGRPRQVQFGFRFTF